MKYQVKEIHRPSGYIDRNHIHVGSELQFIEHVDEQNNKTYNLIVNNKTTSTIFDKHNLGKFKKLFTLKELNNEF